MKTENNEGKYYVLATAEYYGTTGQLCMDGGSTTDLCFAGADVEFDTFEAAEVAAKAVDLHDFADWVLENMKYETTDTPAGGCVQIEIMEGDDGLIDYEYKRCTDGGCMEIKSIRVGCESARAELTRVSGTATDLCADCPECGQSDAYVSTGEHSETGSDFVRCSACGDIFHIVW